MSNGRSCWDVISTATYRSASEKGKEKQKERY
jgi:hypothetical protein